MHLSMWTLNRTLVLDSNRVNFCFRWSGKYDGAGVNGRTAVFGKTVEFFSAVLGIFLPFTPAPS